MKPVRFTSCVFVAACLAAQARTEELLPTDATQALAEYATQRAAVMRRTDAELSKHRQLLLKKLEKIQRSNKADESDVQKQVGELLAKINGPGFTTFEIEEILKKNATSIDTATTKQLQRLYQLNQMTEEQWHALPAVEIVAKAGTQTDTTIVLKAGETVVVCPHPTQKWRKNSDLPWYTWNAPGYDYAKICTAIATVKGKGADVPFQAQLRDTITVTPTINGRLLVGDNQVGHGTPEGVMSFKIFRVKDR
jgi:hypothetical protein